MTAAETFEPEPDQFSQTTLCQTGDLAIDSAPTGEIPTITTMTPEEDAQAIANLLHNLTLSQQSLAAHAHSMQIHDMASAEQRSRVQDHQQTIQRHRASLDQHEATIKEQAEAIKSCETRVQELRALAAPIWNTLKQLQHTGETLANERNTLWGGLQQKTAELDQLNATNPLDNMRCPCREHDTSSEDEGPEEQVAATEHELLLTAIVHSKIDVLDQANREYTLTKYIKTGEIETFKPSGTRLDDPYHDLRVSAEKAIAMVSNEKARAEQDLADSKQQLSQLQGLIADRRASLLHAHESRRSDLQQQISSDKQSYYALLGKLAEIQGQLQNAAQTLQAYETEKDQRETALKVARQQLNQTISSFNVQDAPASPEASTVTASPVVAQVQQHPTGLRSVPSPTDIPDGRMPTNSRSVRLLPHLKGLEVFGQK